MINYKICCWKEKNPRKIGKKKFWKKKLKMDRKMKEKNRNFSMANKLHKNLKIKIFFTCFALLIFQPEIIL